MGESRAVHLVITGTVQGVFYRKWTQERARAHGITGWVRNRDDGAVEAVLSGRPEAVEILIGECRVGPPAARVANIALSEAEPIEAADFEVRD